MVISLLNLSMQNVPFSPALKTSLAPNLSNLEKNAKDVYIFCLINLICSTYFLIVTVSIVVRPLCLSLLSLGRYVTVFYVVRPLWFSSN